MTENNKTVVVAGNKDAKIYVVCEPPQEGKYDPKYPGSASHINFFLKEAEAVGFQRNDFAFIKLCDPIPESIKVSKSKTWKHVEQFLPDLTSYLESVKESKFIVSLGDLSVRAVMGKSHAITKCRGTVINGNVYPMFSAAYVFRGLEQLPTFKADMLTLKKLSENNFDINKITTNKRNYYWCTDLTEIIQKKPKIIAVDTETTGLRTGDKDFEVLVVQIAYDESNVAVVPLHSNFWPTGFTRADKQRIFHQLKIILEDPKIKKIGHNFNYDINALEAEGIEVKGVLADTQLLAWFLDENMFSKTLDDCVRRWYPPMAGYNDRWNAEIDKSNMINLEPEKMLSYGGGDSCATYNLFKVQWNELRRNEHQYNLFIKLKMPGLLAFRKMEREGIQVDTNWLDKLKVDIKADLDRLNKELIDMVPRAVIRKHLANPPKDKKDPCRLSRDAFVRDVLFSPEGFNLTPIVFTKGTKNEVNPRDRVPSVSAKDHLPYFTDTEGTAGDFVHQFIEFTKLDKLYTTYVRDFAEKYVHTDGRIHPQFVLHITTTGRTSSRGPNAQNFPARGNWAKPYKKSFVAGEGYKFVSADLSQIELRLIAWESEDPRMLSAYRNSEDIHKITAMAVSGHTHQTWDLLSKDEQKLLRYRAKAVNFGFCYEMRANKFQRYAKTEYGIDLTKEDAYHYYNTYHNLYKHIKKWHAKRKVELSQNGFVTSLHGSVRRLASVYSKDDFIRSAAERQAINTPIQSFGSDLGVCAIARIARQVDHGIITPVAFIHDDVILRVKDGHEEEAVNMLLWVLNNPPLESMFNLKPPIPIIAEPDVGTSLGNMYELYDLSSDAPDWAKNIKIDPKMPTWWKPERDLI